MISEYALKKYLDDVAAECPDIVISRLSRGSLVRKGGLCTYEIDNPDIYRRLGLFPTGAVPYAQIRHALHSKPMAAFHLFNEKGRRRGGVDVVAFSETVVAGVGECLEKSVLVQLCAQQGRDSYLVSGVLGIAGEPGVSPHAYNIIWKDGKPFLVDVENPALKSDVSDGIGVKPYIVPVFGVDDQNAEFILPEEQRQGRSYVLV